MADRPTISVIIPTRDRPLFLTEALRSVLAQHLRPDQVIVVDDGGAGEARRIADLVGASDSVATAVVEGPGRGPGAARNAGLRAAKGELVAFLDDAFCHLRIPLCILANHKKGGSYACLLKRV